MFTQRASTYSMLRQFMEITCFDISIAHQSRSTHSLTFLRSQMDRSFDVVGSEKREYRGIYSLLSQFAKASHSSIDIFINSFKTSNSSLAVRQLNEQQYTHPSLPPGCSRVQLDSCEIPRSRSHRREPIQP